MQSLDDFAAGKLAALDRSNLHRVLAETERLDGVFVERGGRRLISFCCNDCLSLSHHPAIKAAAIAAIERYGVGSGASRLDGGGLYSPLGQCQHSVQMALMFRGTDCGKWGLDCTIGTRDSIKLRGHVLKAGQRRDCRIFGLLL